MYNLTVTPEELETIGDALDALPYKRVAPLIDKLRGQLATQNTPAVPAAPAPVAEPEVQAAPVEAPPESA